MTKPYVQTGDNGGRCERCDEDNTVGQPQTAVDVLLGGGMGWGQMWVCDKCKLEREERDRKRVAV